MNNFWLNKTDVIEIDQYHSCYLRHDSSGLDGKWYVKKRTEQNKGCGLKKLEELMVKHHQPIICITTVNGEEIPHIIMANGQGITKQGKKQKRL